MLSIDIDESHRNQSASIFSIVSSVSTTFVIVYSIDENNGKVRQPCFIVVYSFDDMCVLSLDKSHISHVDNTCEYIRVSISCDLLRAIEQSSTTTSTVVHVNRIQCLCVICREKTAQSIVSTSKRTLKTTTDN
jgi:hypothetical protein